MLFRHRINNVTGRPFRKNGAPAPPSFFDMYQCKVVVHFSSSIRRCILRNEHDATNSVPDQYKSTREPNRDVESICGEFSNSQHFHIGLPRSPDHTPCSNKCSSRRVVRLRQKVQHESGAVL